MEVSDFGDRVGHEYWKVSGDCEAGLSRRMGIGGAARSGAANGGSGFWGSASANMHKETPEMKRGCRLILANAGCGRVDYASLSVQACGSWGRGTLAEPGSPRVGRRSGGADRSLGR